MSKTVTVLQLAERLRPLIRLLSVGQSLNTRTTRREAIERAVRDTQAWRPRAAFEIYWTADRIFLHIKRAN